MTFRGLEVFDVRIHFDKPEAGQLDDFDYQSRGFGAATPWKPSGALRRTVTLPFALHGLAAIGELRRFVDRQRGRQRPFWLPAWVNEFPLAADAAAAATSLTVTGLALVDVFDPAQRKFIVLATRAGKLECYGVTNVVAAGVGLFTLTLSRGLDTGLVAGDTLCSPLFLARLAEDLLQFDYAAGDVITGQAEFVETATEYPAPEESASATETAHLGTRPVFLWRITDGITTLHLAEYGVDVEAAGEIWQAADITHGSLSSTSDMLGEAVDATLRTDDPAHPLRAYLNEFNLANFSVEIFAADMDGLDALDLTAPEHIGRLEAADFGTEGEIKLEISSLFRLNEREIPTMRMQRTCNGRTFDGVICHAVEADFTTAGTITAVSTDPAYVEAAEFGAKATAEGDANWFALGKVIVGNQKRLCTGQDGNRLYLNFPFVGAAVGNAISAVAGDDKRIGTCDDKFGQLPNHLASPYIPNANPQIEPLKTPAPAGGKKG